MTGWEWMLCGALVGSLVLWRWPGTVVAKPSPWPDVLIGILLGIGGWWYLRYWHEQINPGWVPHGHDNHDYLKCMVALKWHEPELWNAFRYPLYPALSVALAWVADMPLVRAAMEVSVASSALVLVGVYTLGRAFATGPVALVGALAAMRLSIEPNILGTPSAYPLATALYAASLGAVVFAVRDGGRGLHAGAGFTLAAYVATTAKAFPLLLAASVAVLVVATCSGRKDWQGVALFFAPVVGCWWAFHAANLPLHPLEGLVHDVQVQWHLVDAAKPFPDVGWGPELPIAERGYWVIGEADSLWHFPDVVRFLLSPPVHSLPLAEAVQVVAVGIAEQLYLGEWSILVPLSVLGALGAWAGGPASAPRLLAVGLGGVLVAAHLWGLANIPMVPYWSLPVTLTTPVLILAAAALPNRLVRSSLPRQWLAGVPLIAATAWLYWGSIEPLSGTSLAEFVRIRASDTPYRIAVINEVRPLVLPGDEVLDATETHLARSLFDQTGARFERIQLGHPPGGQFELYAPAGRAAQRWVLLDCMTIENLQPNHAYTEAFGWLAARPERFEPFGECLYRDKTPDQPIDTHPDWPPPEAPPPPNPVQEQAAGGQLPPPP